MAEAKHTPAPWSRFDDGGAMKSGHTYGVGYSDCVWGPEGPGYGLIADCSPNGQAPTPETVANARLIAAAPDLLEALQWVMSAHGEQLHDAFDAAHKAIAKATGAAQ